LECFILIRAFPELKLSLMFFGDVEEFHLDAAQYPVAQNWDCSQVPGDTRICYSSRLLEAASSTCSAY
jgi:hypothetical protein